jgi:hypothetical protein
MHPLLKLQAGDKLILPSSTRSLFNGETWVDNIDSAMPTNGCAKRVACPLNEGRAGVRNEVTGERFEFEWKASENNGLGLWLTRGGWHGHHHFAIEPTNAGADALAEAAGRKWCGVVEGNGTAAWQILLRVGSE